MVYEVSKVVGNVRNDVPECLQPVVTHKLGEERNVDRCELDSRQGIDAEKGVDKSCCKTQTRLEDYFGQCSVKRKVQGSNLNATGLGRDLQGVYQY